MAGIVQYYKSQFSIAGVNYPMQAGGAKLNWDKNYDTPAMTGNYSRQCFAEGMQMPTLDVTPVLIDNVSACPIVSTVIDYFLTRSTDYKNDLVSTVAILYYDGFSGRSLPWAKAGAFSIGSSRDSAVRFSASFAAFVPPGETMPDPLSSNPYAYNSFTGTPIRYERVSYYLNGSPFDGVSTWDLSYSNNLSPNMTNVGIDGAAPGTQAQQLFPVDVNAGEPTASLRLTFNADAAYHVHTGDVFEVHIDGENVHLHLNCPQLVVNNPDTRELSTNKNLRAYNCTVMSTSNATNPVVRV